MASPGSVEKAIRRSIETGSTLTTFARNKAFVVEQLNSDGIVLLLGAGQWRTPLSWECMEGVAGFLRGRGWIIVGSSYEVDGDPNTLDGYLKGCVNRATASWVARVLEKAGVVELDGRRPLSLRLRRGY